MSKIITKKNNSYELTFSDQSSFYNEFKIYKLNLDMVPRLLDFNINKQTLIVECIEALSLQEIINSGKYNSENLLYKSLDLLQRFREEIRYLNFKPFSNEAYENTFLKEYGKAMNLDYVGVIPSIDVCKSHGDFHTENILCADKMFVVDFEQIGIKPVILETVKLVCNGSLNIPSNLRRNILDYSMKQLGIEEEQMEFVKLYESVRLYNRLKGIDDNILSDVEINQKGSMLEYICDELKLT